MSVQRILTFLCCFLIIGCMAASNKPDPIVEKNYTLLHNQQDLLIDHASRLDQLSHSQELLSTQFGEMQQQINSIGQKMATVSNYVVQASVREKTDSEDEKPVRVVTAPVNQNKAVLGRVEYIWFEDAREYLKARIDTGAKLSTINAGNVQPFERNGDRWVRFDVVFDERSIIMEAPIERHVRIRLASVEGYDRRPVVKLSVQLGELSEETEFTLSNRDEMLYPVLLGRSFLQDIAVVDVAKKFTRRRDPKLASRVTPQ